MADAEWPTVGKLLQRAASLWGRREAASDGQRRFTYQGLLDRALRLANGLRHQGLKPGDRVAFIGHNSLEYLEAYFGVPIAGLVLLPINTRLAADEIRYILQDAECSAVIVGEGFEDIITHASSDLDVQLINIGPESLGSTSYTMLLENNAAVQDTYRSHSTDLAYLYYTSGTTGRPKGVMLSHQNVLAGSLSADAAIGIRGSDSWLHAGPMFHLADAWAIWGFTWLGGRHVVSRFDPEKAIHLISTEHITYTLLVPTALSMLLDVAEAAGRRLTQMRGMLYGGAPMPSTLYERANGYLACPLIATYGMTETSGLITVLSPDELASGNKRAESVGKEAPLIDLLLQDEQGNIVPADTVGEVVVTSPATMMGYWKRPVDTAEVLQGTTLKTGDLGRRDEDGFLYLVDRKKDMIISGGENIYSAEVERVLSQHPAVLEVAVVGQPDPKWGEIVCAFIRTTPGRTIELAEIRSFARQYLASYKLPRAIRIVDTLPRTASGKVNKAELRKLVRGDENR